MEELRDVRHAEERVLADIRHFLSVIRNLSCDVHSICEGAKRLRQVRNAVYEDLNQIQHECLILQGLHWLRDYGYAAIHLQWQWNPRQTGDANEPDLLARDNSGVVLSAEATTSENPKGVIDIRMRNTLAKLNAMQGKKYYFVKSDAMAKRARTKIAKNSWNIEVVQIA
jgi:hypothetical protein